MTCYRRETPFFSHFRHVVNTEPMKILIHFTLVHTSTVVWESQLDPSIALGSDHKPILHFVLTAKILQITTSGAIIGRTLCCNWQRFRKVLRSSQNLEELGNELQQSLNSKTYWICITSVL